jgi:hypothetical protein
LRRSILRIAATTAILFALVAPAGAHTLAPHAHTHGIQADGGGWYHSSTKYSCDGDWIRTWHKHYTYLAAKRAYVLQHYSNSYQFC